MIKLLLSTIAIVAFACPAFSQLKADFMATESAKEIYRNGFDTQEELDQWTLTTTNAANTWHTAKAPRAETIPAFTSINPKSVASMAIWYDSKVQQDETIISQAIDIPQNAKCSFHACFDGVYVLWGNLTLVATEEDGKATEIFNAFLWSQESGHETPKWLPFSIDLSAFAGKKIKFSFNYKGVDGDDVLLDDFIITQPDMSEESKVTINEGEEVHFIDASTGNPTSWAWSFEGAEVASSTEQNPIIKYNSAGTYKVSLTVKDATSESTKVREAYVIVKGQAPNAILEFPQEGYLSPWTAIFIPKETAVTFTDKSKGNPTEWKWQFTGADIATSTDKNPTVSYAKNGVYSVALTVKNSLGTDSDIYENAIQVGGKQNIWNIEMSETSGLAPIEMGWYGNYGGTNWLDMPGFAEYFKKPIVKGKISAVDIFFAKTATVTPNAVITVSVAASENGLPGTILGSAALLASELKNDPSTYLETTFTFNEPVAVEDEFFITILGIPNNTDETTFDSDDIAMFCSPRREDGGKSTVYHLLDVLDENYQPTGKQEWYKNDEEFISFAIAPKFQYDDGSSVESTEVAQTVSKIIATNEMIEITTNGEINSIEVYSISGQQVISETTNNISTSNWAKGIYIVKAIIDGKVVVEKVII